MRHRPVLVVLAAALSATPAAAQSQAGAKPQSTGEAARDAATQPLADTGISKREPPAALVAIEKQPYAIATLKSCAMLARAIADMDAVLGPDVDATPEQREKAADTAIKVAGGVIDSVIPARGIVRLVSGADKAEKRYAQAVYAGVARRAYLKGVSSTRGCR